MGDEEGIGSSGEEFVLPIRLKQSEFEICTVKAVAPITDGDIKAILELIALALLGAGLMGKEEGSEKVPSGVDEIVDDETAMRLARARLFVEEEGERVLSNFRDVARIGKDVLRWLCKKGKSENGKDGGIAPIACVV